MSDSSKTSSSHRSDEEEETESIVTEDTDEYDSVAPEGTEGEIIFEGDELSGFYDPEEYISKPLITETCSLSEDALKFHYSFGYDCQKYYNLCVADEEHIIFISGNLIHIFNVETKELQFRRSAKGGGIGHIVKNPKYPHIAVGEKGNNPLIVIYHWPSFNIITVLRKGTKNEYTHLSYSPDGELLCSQGGNPDLLLTIWNWSKSSILLRTKAHGQDVINAEFSQHVPGHLASSGLGHIKFWKMAHTFTGLKLQGEIGRFGKTEICDIVGIYSMPDEKVLSGSEWGNILVWESGSIKVEVSQRGRRNCHSAEISQIIYDSVTNEVITVGMDGWIKMWTYSVIDLADPPEDDLFVEMQPLFEVEVKNELHSAQLRSIVKRNNDYEDFMWFAQDHNGGLWKIDLNLTQQVELPKQLLACHSGAVIDIASSPADYLLASLGTDGWIYIYNVIENKIITIKRFKSNGTSLIWLPQHVESSGTVLIGGFSDGRIRMFAILFNKTKEYSTKATDRCIRIIQISKPHTSNVTKISLNPRGSVLVTGSDDSTIFVYQINPKKEFVSLEPIGFVSTPGPVRHINWKPDQMCEALISCSNGHLLEVRLPEHKVQYTKTSYKLRVNRNILQFKSVRSEIERESLLKEIEFKKNEKLNRKKAELEKIKAENPGLDIDEEMFLVDSEEEEELPPLYYPETPNAILFAKYTNYNSIWLSVDGYDAGYIYEYKFGSENPVKSTYIPESDNVAIRCYSELENGKYLILGFSNGKIRIVEVDNERDCDFSKFWELPMHDNFNGHINQLCFSYDYKFLYSCGNDGNIFTYEVNIPCSFPVQKRKLILTSLQLKDMTDAEDDTDWSLEEIKKNEESENRRKLANARKRKVQKKLEKLKDNYYVLKSRNMKLPSSQVLPQTEFELDARITEFIENQINYEFNLMKRKVAFKLAKSKLRLSKLQNYFLENISTIETEVTGIRKSISVSSFNHRKHGEELCQAQTETENFIKSSMLGKDILDESLVQRRKGSSITVHSKSPSFENYLLQISSIYDKLDVRIKRAIRKQRLQKQNKLNRLEQWREFMDLKPDINVTDPEDIKAIETAIKEMGDFKLKTDENYSVPDNLHVATAHKYLGLLKAQHEVFQMKDGFNKKLLEMQDRKIALTKTIKQLHFDLDLLHNELTEDQIKMPPPVPEIRIATGFSQLKSELNSADPGFYVPVPGMYDDEHIVLNLDVATFSSHALSHQRESIPCEDIHALQELSANDTIDTPWEKEMMCFRLTRKSFEQDEMLKHINQSITDFDNDLQALHNEKLQLAVEIKFLEIFVLTLSEELIIIRSYSTVENAISDKITTCKADKNDKMQEVNAMQFKIEAKIQEVAQIQEKQFEIQQTFTDMVADNKFSTYLTRLFKKKKKVNTEDSDTESSSTDDESIGDIYDDDEDSPEFITMNLGESICPPGCDQEVFQKTLALRMDRYDLDDAVAEAKKVIENLQKELDSHTKLIKSIDTVLQNFVNDLTAVEKFYSDCVKQREKQKKLNNVDTVVLLRLSQLQNIEATNKYETLENTLVFRKQMLDTLNYRVNELGGETENEKMKRKKYRKYLCNLDRGGRIMKERFQFLKKEVKKSIVDKFGSELDIDVMEQTVLRRMINDARCMFSLKKIRLLMDERISQLQEALLVKLEQLSLIQRNNTKRIQLKTMLKEEITNIHALLMYETINKDKFATDIRLKQYQDEIQKLENVIFNQLEEKKFLEHEIKLLTYKTLPPLHIDQIYIPTDKTVFVPEISVSDTDKLSKKDSEESVKSPFSICEEIMEHILEQVNKNIVIEVSKYDSDKLKTLKSAELIIKEILNDIIMLVECSDLEEVKSSVQVTKMLMDELVESSLPVYATSAEIIAVDVVENIIDNLSDYGHQSVDYLEITEGDTDFDLVDSVNSSESDIPKTICVIIIEDIINNLPI